MSVAWLETSLTIPTTSEPVTYQLFENLIVAPDLTIIELVKHREQPFGSFDEYSRRLGDATASIFANAVDYEPVVSLSSGFDSTAVAAVASRAGCQRAVGFRTARPSRLDGSTDDSGEPTATLLGMGYEAFDRLAYRGLYDLPEAEFLATGMAGEEIVFRSMEPALKQRTLLTGYWAGTQWAMPNRDEWRHVYPTTTAGASMAEFRLRADFFNVPLPVFGAVGGPNDPSLLDRAEMAPFRLGGGHYDRPIPRRLAEEAGIPRGTFGLTKRAVNVVLHVEGLNGFTPRSRKSLEDFAAVEGRRVPDRRRRQFSRPERAAVKVAERMGMTNVAAHLRTTAEEPRSLRPTVRQSGSSVGGQRRTAPLRGRPSAGRGFCRALRPMTSPAASWQFEYAAIADPADRCPGWRPSVATSSAFAADSRSASANTDSSRERGRAPRIWSRWPSRRPRSARESS